MQLARRGDPRAHEVLFRTYAAAVYDLALRLLQQPAAADEILQDTFVEVLSRITAFRGDAPIGAWIREIAVNKCLMQFRSGWQRYRRTLDEDAEWLREPMFTESLAERIDLGRALALLAPMSRVVVWLHDVEGYTHHEIARRTGKSISFSKSQLARAHRRLQAVLGGTTGDTTCTQVSNRC